jgi:hypothetical protein
MRREIAFVVHPRDEFAALRVLGITELMITRERGIGAQTRNSNGAGAEDNNSNEKMQADHRNEPKPPFSMNALD